jgi:hypothetical protein
MNIPISAYPIICRHLFKDVCIQYERWRATALAFRRWAFSTKARVQRHVQADMTLEQRFLYVRLSYADHQFPISPYSYITGAAACDNLPWPASTISHPRRSGTSLATEHTALFITIITACYMTHGY